MVLPCSTIVYGQYMYEPSNSFQVHVQVEKISLHHFQDLRRIGLPGVSRTQKRYTFFGMVMFLATSEHLYPTQVPHVCVGMLG